MNPGYPIASLAALFWGGADFLGGLAAKRAPAPLVTCFAGFGGLAVTLAGMAVFPGSPTRADLAWGAAAGAFGAASASLMYQALALGPMSLASPVFSLIGLCVPVIVGVGLGERPSLVSWAGVGLAMLAIPLLSRTAEGPGHHSRAHVRRTLGVSIAAGLVVGWFLVCLARISEGAGLLPLVAARLSGMAVLAAWIAGRHRDWLRIPEPWKTSLTTGALDSTANLAFVLAAQRAPLVLVSALVSLAPAATVLFARLTLGERWTVAQVVGLGLALVAGACISVG